MTATSDLGIEINREMLRHVFAAVDEFLAKVECPLTSEQRAALSAATDSLGSAA
jgi:hypothetical protein